MPEVIRRRTIRPSTRKKTSPNYRVHLDGLSAGDTLVVIIDHESKPFQKTFKFNASAVLKKKSLGFKLEEVGEVIQVQWISTQPING